MGWEDRDYNRGGENYLGNPAAILGYSIPFGTWFGVRVRLHFWLLISIAFAVIDIVRGIPLPLGAIGIALLLLTLLIHDFTHRVVAQVQGGRHDEFMLWPAGGLVFPTIPPGAWPMFAVYVGPIVVHAAIALICLGVAGVPLGFLPLDPLAGLSMEIRPPSLATLDGILIAFAIANWVVMLVNLLPYYWFDGGCLLQSILWPFTGAYRAINVTCIIGMILAVPMFALAFMSHNFLGLVFWALLFSGSYSRRRQLQAEGTAQMADAMEWSAQSASRTGPRSRRWFQPDVAKAAIAQRNAQARRDRQNDRILAKVSAQGMNSLTWWERRSLRKATEEQNRIARRRG